MIYNSIWYSNLNIKEQAAKAYKTSDITEEELRNIENKYPVGFFSPNLFIRIGLIILTCVISLFSSGLFVLMIGFDNTDGYSFAGLMIFLGLFSYVVLEIMVRQNHHFRSGVDDALLWISGGLLLAGTSMLLDKSILNHVNDSDFMLRLSIIAFILSTYLTLRFADFMMSMAACMSFLTVCFFSWLKIGSWGLSSASFFFMVVSVLLYWLARKFNKKAELIHYKNCLKAVEIISLITFYAAGNYIVVSSFISNAEIGSKNPSLPLGWFFWTWTIAIPFVYIALGLKKKNAVLLRLGLLLLTVAAYTFRTYYHIMPIEVTFTVIGIILISISYGIINYLKQPKHGFTYADLDEENLIDKLNVESLVIAQTFAAKPFTSTKEMEFGGGSFGGGGAGEKF